MPSQSLPSSKFDFYFSYSIHSVSICSFAHSSSLVTQLAPRNSIDYWIVAFGSILSLLSTPSFSFSLSSPSLSHPPSFPPSLLILSFLPWHLDRLFSATSCITHRLHQSRPPSPRPSHTRYTCKAPPGVTPHILTSINNVLPDVFRSPEGLDWSRGTLQTFLPLPHVFQHYLYCFFSWPYHTRPTSGNRAWMRASCQLCLSTIMRLHSRRNGHRTHQPSIQRLSG